MPTLPDIANRKYTAKYLWDNYRQIARMIAAGLKNIEIAAETGLTPQQISNIRNSPIVREWIEFLQDEMDKDQLETSRRIRELAPTAVETLKEVMEDKSGLGSDRRQAATALLDRGGFGPVRTVKSDEGNLTTEEVEGMVERAKGANINLEVIEEASYEEVKEED